MPIPHIRMIYCERCGKLLKVEGFGDAMTLEEWKKFNNTKEKKVFGNVECYVSLITSKLY